MGPQILYIHMKYTTLFRGISRVTYSYNQTIHPNQESLFQLKTLIKKALTNHRELTPNELEMIRAMPSPAQLQEGVDYFINRDGNLVFTGFYHLRRGYCCDNSCQNCPYR